LDEGLDVLVGLWSGEMFGYDGEHYHLHEMKFLPSPAQKPRIPIWVGGWWPNKPPMRRAARWDGVIPGRLNGVLSPDEWRDLLAYIRQYRTGDAPFDAVHSGETSGTDAVKDREIVASYAEAGVNWWIEDVSPYRFGWGWEDQLTAEAARLTRERVRQGPPK
jgi:alkanesulfonate monooxygenase SsuD/methylene tetrahydromethanopterin reductase-like flavin-dependent oxidoreductase (luciferase family)